MNDDIIIQAKGLSRSFKKLIKGEGLRGSLRSLFHREVRVTEAVADFDFVMRRGEALGLVGPNGAGKTTLVKLLSGLIRPDSGSLSVLGSEPAKRGHPFLSRIALVMGQKSQLWWDLPARDSFLLNQAIYGIPEKPFRETLGRLASALSAEKLLDSPVRSLSLGERMRMEFIAAMLHGPELVFLDEPTIGLDAPAQKVVRDFLKRENAERGLSLILTSHYMDDIRKLCPRCVLVQGGRKAFDGGTEEMLGTVRERKILRVVLAAETDFFRSPAFAGFAEDPGAADPPGFGSALAEVDGETAPAPKLRRPRAELIEEGPCTATLAVRPDSVQALLALVLDHCEVADLSIEEEEIADSMIKLYRKEGFDAR